MARVDACIENVMNKLLTIFLTALSLVACQKHPSAAGSIEKTKSERAPVASEPQTATPVKSYDGPFGLESGLSIAELERMKFIADDNRPGLFDGHPPRPLNGAAANYIVVASKAAGLCRIQASVDVPTANGSGDQMRSETDRVAEMMRVKYGKHSSKITYVREDVYRRNPQFWMMGLSEDSVIYAYTWEQGKTEKELPGNIQDIEISARASSISSGWVAIRYTFKNFATCQQEIKATKASNL